jgi:hypothetical protein
VTTADLWLLVSLGEHRSQIGFFVPQSGSTSRLPNFRHMDKYITGFVVRADETEAFAWMKPLDDAGTHFKAASFWKVQFNGPCFESVVVNCTFTTDI